MSARSGGENVAELCERFRRQDRLALSRLLTLAARGECTDALRQLLAGDVSPAHPTPAAHHSPLTTHSSAAHSPLTTHSSPLARRIAITGSGGVGKSTLIGKLIDLIRGKGEHVAVLACDPQSPRTGGALLGDRIRMPTRPGDLGAFIRSLATPAGSEGIAPHLDLMIGLLATFGFRNVLVETVGAGQGDTAVRQVAGVVVVLVQPEAGDELQWEKAGLLEIADVVVVHKADLPGAERVESQLREQLQLPGCRPVPVVRVSSSRGQGLEELWQLIAAAAN